MSIVCWDKFRKLLKRINYAINPTYRTLRRVEDAIANLSRRVDESDYRNEQIFWWQMHLNGETAYETRRRVFEQMPAAEGELRQRQLENLELLKAVRDVCKQNNIEFWISCGTLLGALRHKGFIPWDDDVDISMLRSQRDRLEEILGDHPLLRMERFYNTKFGFQVDKIFFRNSKKNSFVDILLYDTINTARNGFSATWNAIQSQRAALNNDMLELSRKFSREYNNEILSEKDKAKLIECNRIRYAGLPSAEEPDGIYRSIDSVYTFSGTIDSLSLYFPLTEVTFEDDVFPAPCGAEKITMSLYHNYLRLPRDLSPQYHGIIL